MMERRLEVEAADSALLRVRDLSVGFLVGRGQVDILDHVDFDIVEDEVLAVIGETGCGKSVMGNSILHLLPDNALVSGEIRFRGEETTHMTEEQFRSLRGEGIMSIAQNPLLSLDPLMKVGDQVGECVLKGEGTRRRHGEIDGESPAGNGVADEKNTGLAKEGEGRLTRNENKVGNEGAIKQRVLELFGRLKLPEPREVYGEYPCELSGGMCQRVLISMGAITHPKLLVVDEPTKAIDWSLRRDVLEMLRSLKEDMHCALLLITHDIPLARKLADNVAVMYAGSVIEKGPADKVLGNPRHPYTKGLLDSTPERGFKVMDGFMPSFLELPPGCRFSDRCQFADDGCRAQKPPFREVEKDWYARCRRSDFVEQMEARDA